MSMASNDLSGLVSCDLDCPKTRLSCLHVISIIRVRAKKLPITVFNKSFKGGIYGIFNNTIAKTQYKS